MIFPQTFEQKLGFDSIRKMIRDHCLCQLGKNFSDNISFSTDLQEIEKQLFETEELRQILLFEENFPSQDYYDLTSELSRIRIEGSYMEPEVLAELKLSLFSIIAIQSFILKRQESKYPRLSGKAQMINIDAQILKKIEKIIDDHANIRDSASPTLKKIRNDRSAKQAEVENLIGQTLRKAIRSGWSPDDSGLTIRDGRLVIPLVAKFKRQISGLIHDESSTGQTVYLEPAEAVEINNEIKELDFAERREII